MVELINKVSPLKDEESNGSLFLLSAQTTDLLNTAVLTGRMVSVPVKTLAVDVDGSVSDVTNYTSCKSTEEDVIKVCGSTNLLFLMSFFLFVLFNLSCMKQLKRSHASVCVFSCLDKLQVSFLLCDPVDEGSQSDKLRRSPATHPL